MASFRRFAFLVAAGLLAPPGAGAGVVAYLALSESDTDPWQQVSQPWTGDRTFHLWFVNNWATELQFELTGTLQVLSFTTAPGVQNVGTQGSPQILFSAGCSVPDPQLATLLGAVVIRDPDGGGGSVCFAPSQTTGRFCFRDCYPEGNWWDLYPEGIQTKPGEPCGLPPSAPDCFPLSVEGVTWGRVKARYR